MASTAAASPSDNSKKKDGPPAKPREFNPRWKGYLYILITSLVNFASVSNLDVDDDGDFRGEHVISVLFGVFTFIFAVVILVTDRFQYCCKESFADRFNYTKSMDGKFEGYALLACTIWWIVGVAHITQVDGVAYVATNIYFSSWGALVSCVYTLDKWSAAKDILSIHELTGISATLKSWYLLFLASLVTMGTSCDLHIHLSEDNKGSAAYGIVLGLVSTLLSLFFLLVHYRMFDYEFLQVGGWIELSASFFMILVWVIGVSILTAEGGIAATIGGSGCVSRSDSGFDFGQGCYVVWVPPEENTESPSSVPTDSAAPSSVLTNIATSVPSLIGGETNTTVMLQEAPTQSPNSLPPVQSPGNLSTTEAPKSTSAPTQSIQNSTATIAPSAATTFGATSTEVPAELPEDVVTTSPTGISTLDTSMSASNLSFAEVNENSNNGTRLLQEVEDPLLEFNTTNSTNATSFPSIAPSILSSNPPSYIPSSVPSSFPTGVQYNQIMTCADLIETQVPGSNLYLAAWVCFFASFNVTLRWKAAQAIQFAQTQHQRAAGIREDERIDSERDGENGDADDDDDDDRDPGSSHHANDDGL